jgi:hypothetical protein
MKTINDSKQQTLKNVKTKSKQSILTALIARGK